MKNILMTTQMRGTHRKMGQNQNHPLLMLSRKHMGILAPNYKKSWVMTTGEMPTPHLMPMPSRE